MDDLDDIVDAMTWGGGEMGPGHYNYLDVQTKEVICLPEELVSRLDDEEDTDDLPEWERELLPLTPLSPVSHFTIFVIFVQIHANWSFLHLDDPFLMTFRISPERPFNPLAPTKQTTFPGSPCAFMIPMIP